MQLDIEKGAGSTIVETETESLRLAKWSPSPWSAVSRRSVSARAAISAPPVGGLGTYPGADGPRLGRAQRRLRVQGSAATCGIGPNPTDRTTVVPLAAPGGGYWM
jgi:hypothetical protein